MTIRTLDKNSKKGFSLLAGINRPIAPNHVTKLAKSIELIGIIRPVIVALCPFIDGGKAKFLIDGQHLYHALLRMELDIPYLEIEVNDEKDLVEKIASLNASSKTWALLDYIVAWKYLKKDYKLLEELYNTFDIELSTIAQVAMKRNATSDGKTSLIIKKGDFKINDLEYTKQILGYTTDTLKIIPRMDRVSNRLFINTYISKVNIWGSSYKHDVFLKYLTKNKSRFALATQSPEELNKLIEKAI